MEPRITLITLGVADLDRAIRFYRDGLRWPTVVPENGGVAFINTAGTRLALFPEAELVKDIGGAVQPRHGGFGGFTLAHNVREKAQVAQVLAFAEHAGARIVKPAQDTFWGGHCGCFTDPDGFCWEVAYNPFNPLDDAGFMTLMPPAA